MHPVYLCLLQDCCLLLYKVLDVPYSTYLIDDLGRNERIISDLWCMMAKESEQKTGVHLEFNRLFSRRVSKKKKWGGLKKSLKKCTLLAAKNP
jgi:hypothetical protein